MGFPCCQNINAQAVGDWSLRLSFAFLVISAIVGVVLGILAILMHYQVMPGNTPLMYVFASTFFVAPVVGLTVYGTVVVTFVACGGACI